LENKLKNHGWVINPPNQLKMITLIFGANGSIGQLVAEAESKKGLVIGTYRKKDETVERLSQIANIELYQQDFIQNPDTAQIVNIARSRGTISKIYFLVGESWNIFWSDATLEDFTKAINLCALPIASLLINLKTELNDKNNFMRWASVSGGTSRIRHGGPNKPTTGSAKNMAEYFFQSASGYWSWQNNLFNNITLGHSHRTKNTQVGYPEQTLKEIYNTDIPLGNGTNPANVANFLLWLNSDSNQFITGENIVMDGGETVRTRDNITTANKN